VFQLTGGAMTEIFTNSGSTSRTPQQGRSEPVWW